MAQGHSTGFLSGPHRRGPLHQRSNSDKNVQQLPPSDNVASPLSTTSVSAKTQNVSAPHTSGATVRRHRADTNSSAASSRSKSLRSHRSHGTSASVDSLPTVPPLRIQKDRLSLSSLAQIPSATPATDSYARGGPYYTSAARQLHTRSTSNAKSVPKSILKKPSSSTLPPQTPQEYHSISSSWTGAFPPLPRTEMMEPTLRAVAASSDGAPSMMSTVSPMESSPGATSYDRYSDVESSPAYSHANRNRGSVYFAADHQIMNQNSQFSPPENQFADPPPVANNGRQYPAWARYFYGNRAGRTSVIGPRSSSPGDPETIGQALSSPSHPNNPYHQPYDTPQIHEIPQPQPGYISEKDSDVTTMWSLPHLDQTPLTRFENVDRQLLLFCLGFLIPVCWMVASFLPLPKQYRLPRGSRGSMDLEAVAMDLYTSKAARQDLVQRYENARWWRRVNRGLSVAGVLVLVAIVTLVVVAHYQVAS